MQRWPPSPSPGPGWEALKETPTTDSSGEEDEITDDTDIADSRSKFKSQPPLKRKEAEQLGSTSKRPRHEQDRRQSEGDLILPGSTSASVLSRDKWLQNNNALASTSKPPATPTTAVNLTTGPSSVPMSMPPPPLPKRAGTDGSSVQRLPSTARPRPLPVPLKSRQTVTTTSKSIAQVFESAGESSSKKKVIHSTSSDPFGRTATSQAGPSSGKRSTSSNEAPRSQAQHRKSQSAVSNEVIDLCFDDSPPAPPKPKARSSMPNPVINMSDDENAKHPPRKRFARKSIGGKAPQMLAAKSSITGPNEIIEISSDSDVEPTKPASSKDLPKQGAKRASVPKPRVPSLPKKQTDSLGSKSANESDGMKVDKPASAISSRIKSSTPAAVPAAIISSKYVSSDDMQVDSLVSSRPFASVQPMTQGRPPVSSNSAKPSSRVASSSGSNQVGPVQSPSVATALPKRPSSQDMQVDEGTTGKSSLSAPKKTNASSGQPSSSTPNLSKLSIPRQNNATQKAASTRQESSTVSGLGTHSIGTSNQLTQSKPLQVAMKSAGALKHSQKGFSSSSPDSDKAGSPSSPISPEASSTDGGVDMRDLDHALGLVGSISSPATPERTIPVKEQPISPQITQSAKGKVKQDSQSSLKMTSRTSAKFQHRGNTVESAIDLTSDNEDAPMADLTALTANSQKHPNPSSIWKGKGRALPSSPTPPPPLVTPRAATDELLLRPSGPEPSLPPASLSSPVNSPFVPMPNYLQTDEGHSRIEASKKPPSTLVLAENSSLSKAQVSPSKTPSAFSTGFKSDVLATGVQIQLTPPVTSGASLQDANLTSKAHISVVSMGGPSKSLQTPSTGATPIASIPEPASASRNSQAKDSSRSSPVIPAKETTPSMGGFPSKEPGKPTIQDATKHNVGDVADTSDVEMQDNESDHDAMQETEEVQALIEEDEYGNDDDILDSEEHSLLRFDNSNEAGPSDSSISTGSMNRPYSRRSSRSSTSAASRVASDDDEIIPHESDAVSRNTTPDDGPMSTKPRGKTLGGFPAFTWKEYRQDLSNFTPKCFYAKDLPHALQDHMNMMSEYTRKMPAVRDVFQAMIQENTIENEPHAPAIELFNDIDDEPTPPWEFHYTNEMWHGEGVPPPDIRNVTSCTCKGACSPKSKTCACLKRQREAMGDPNAEFMYDKAGRLRITGWPVNECNDLCGCGDECRNRVVQHGRKVQINIKKTEHKGWGVFAGSKRIAKGSFIGIYSGELLTDAEAHERGINYNKFGRTYLFDLDFHHLRDPTNDQDGWTSKFTVDAYHAGNFTRFLNHSCDPNCILQPLYINEGNLEKPLLVIFSDRDIEPYEEICFNYTGEPDEAEEGPGEPGSPSKTDKIYAPCMCGAHNCTGNMFRPPTN